MKNQYLDKWEGVCDKANEKYSLAALDKYSKESLHKECLVAESLEETCRAEIANLKRGNASANFVFACCADCFADILSAQIEYTFTAFSPMIGDDEDFFVVPLFPNKVPDISTQAKLEKFLARNGINRSYTRHVPVWDDIKRRNAYLKALRTLLETGAALAKRIGDEICARELLNALRLTMRRTSYNEVVNPLAEIDPIMTYDQAKALYAAVESALSSLWVSVKYHDLKPLAVKRRKAR